MLTRSRIAVGGAVAILTAAVLLMLAGGSDDAAQTPPRAKHQGRLAAYGGDPFAFGRGATDPAAAASSAATKDGGSSALDTVGLPEVDPCTLLPDATVDSAIGPQWAVGPVRTSGTLQCRWWVDAKPPLDKAEGEIRVTVARATLYRRLRRSPVKGLAGLGDEAIVSSRSTGDWIAVRSGQATLLVALSLGSGSAEIAALAQEAVEGLEADSRAGNG